MRKEQDTKPRRRPVKRIVITALKGILLFGTALAVIGYTNFTVDPSNLYDIGDQKKLEFQIVEYMLQGYNVEGVDNYDERLTRRLFINAQTEPFDVLVVGSSRGALITTEMLGAENLFNASVAGGTLTDVIGYYGILHQKGLLPETLLIAVDPWMLNDNYVQERSMPALGDGYYHYLTERMGYSVPTKVRSISGLYTLEPDDPIRFRDLPADAQLNLFSIPYFQASIQRLTNPNYTSNSAISPSYDTLGVQGLLRSDGSYSYPLSYRSADLETVTYRAGLTLPSRLIGLENFETLEGQNTQMLRDFLRCVQEDGVAVQLLLEPISPVLYDHMHANERYKLFFREDSLLYDIAEEAGVAITGSFNPYSLHLDMSSFYDGYHLIPEVIAEMVAPFRKIS